MPKHSSGLHSVARLTAALHTPRYMDAGAVYWSSDDFRFAAASLAGEPLWDVEVEDGGRLVGIFEGHPVVLTRRLDPPFVVALVFLDPASGREVRRVAAPKDAAEAAYCDGVFAFLTASKRLGATNRLVLADAATGKFKKIVEGGLATGLTAIAGGFLCTLDFVVRAYDLKGRSLWTTDNVVSVFGETVLATNLGGKLARLRPADGKPLWSFTFKGAEAQSLVQVHAGADVVAVLEPRLGELALLDLATGKLRWRTKRVAATSFAPPLVTPDAVVTLSARKAGGTWQALAAFSLADGSLRAELANRHGFNMTDARVAGEVCVLGQEDGTALHVVRVPASNAASTGSAPERVATQTVATTAKKRPTSAASAKKTVTKNQATASAKKTAAKKSTATAASAKKTAARKTPATASAKKTAARKTPASAASTKKKPATKKSPRAGRIKRP
ncbi:PQQ-binding-like beta-propeller repeat protein [Nannocystis sp. ILAH1]|uniref:outer membrane protein assembly factor BamB family protein n=1 Tax=Nannocystis sp. ILAH1 TaxID=2996789 RepID=UPI0022700E5F|nr:PQQ-binding-like beta-propeller repeat protein [Nannocystis sp. ILAH1]MCY0990545.1 PQQ-binding-like beta-propeller repeat protein [Nannocystis sp. ILAH1]